jgi:simple sugar transport system ATP-binding protein
LKMDETAVRLVGVSKAFGGFQALAGADFSARFGEIHALLGENGAGKSSLMNIAAGLYQPDAGTIFVEGAPRRFSGPRDAASAGIGMVHQHFKLVKRFTVAENILLANPRPGFRKSMREIEPLIRQQGEELGLQIDPARTVGSLSIAEQQRVEIIKVLVAGAKILILDEPTAVLTDDEALGLLHVVRNIAQSGKAVILVTHKMAEVINFAHDVTVMCDGRTVANVRPGTSSAAELTRLTVGAESPQATRPKREVGPVRLTVKDLVCDRPGSHAAVAGASFFVRGGEIYGLAGVGGNGQTELAEAIGGVRKPSSGVICLDHLVDITTASPRQRRKLGLACIPADRQALGLANSLSVAENFAIGQLGDGRYGTWAFTSGAAVRTHAAAALGEFDVQGVRRLGQAAALLSGGNAQKLVLSREFSRAPTVIVAHSPSRGLDARACAAVQSRLLDARDSGAAVLLISENLDEILSLSDRVGVMTRGRIVAEFDAPADRQKIGRALVDHE